MTTNNEPPMPAKDIWEIRKNRALTISGVELLDSQSPIKLSPAAKEQLKTYHLPVALSGTAHGISMSSGGATISVGKATASAAGQ